MFPRLISSLLLFSMIFFLAGCEREVGLGVVDLDRVLEEAPRAIYYQDKLDEEGREIEDRYQVDSDDISNEERLALQEQAYQEYQAVKDELEEKLNNEIEQAVKEVAEQENLDIIFYKQAVSFGGQDITEQVVERLQ